MRPWLGRERQVRKWWPRRSARHMPARSRISQPPTCTVGLGKSSPTLRRLPLRPGHLSRARVAPSHSPRRALVRSDCTVPLSAPSRRLANPIYPSDGTGFAGAVPCPPRSVGLSPPPLSTRGSKREVSANLKARSKVGKQGGGCDVRDGKRGTRDARRQSFSPGSDGEQLSLDRFALLSLLVVRSWWRSGVGHLCFSNTSTTPERRPRDS